MIAVGVVTIHVDREGDDAREVNEGREGEDAKDIDQKSEGPSPHASQNDDFGGGGGFDGKAVFHNVINMLVRARYIKGKILLWAR